MIVKKIKLWKGASKRVSIGALVDYIRDPTRGGKPHERLLYTHGRGFVFESPETQRAEMIALAEEAVRSKQPVTHYILSWREGEKPNPEQIERAVDIFLGEMGLVEHQCIYALHGDTDHVHLHIIVNRVHPESIRVIEPNRGWDLKAAHRAIARIEHEQGWQPEKRAVYRVLENGELERDRTPRKKPPTQRARDYEARTGEKSAQRIAQEQASGVIERVRTWSELHRELAKLGMRYEKKGSGAILWVGEQPVKASSVSREASFGQLEKRLGAYQPAEPVSMKPVTREPVKPNMPRWDIYVKDRQEHYELKRIRKIEMDRRHAEERKQLAERLKQQRLRVLSGSWKGQGTLLLAVRSVLAAEQAAERAALRARHQRERARWRKMHPPFPPYQRWFESMRYILSALDPPKQNSRYQEQCIEGESCEPLAQDIRAFKPVIHHCAVHYYHISDVCQQKRVAFVDLGQRISVLDWQNPNATLAALQLASMKWGKFSVTGSDEYKTLCAKLAAVHGFEITNPELQPLIKQERQRIGSSLSAKNSVKQNTEDPDMN